MSANIQNTKQRESQVATVLTVAAAMQALKAKKVWWEDPTISAILIEGAKAGYLRRISITQVEWTHAGAQALAVAYTNRQFVANNPNFFFYVLGCDGYLTAAFDRQDEAQEYAKVDVRRRVIHRSELCTVLPEFRGEYVDISTLAIEEPADAVLVKYISVAADSIASLRKVDVYRVLESVPTGNCDGVTRSCVASFIVRHRPELEQEVTEVMHDEFAGEEWPVHQAQQVAAIQLPIALLDAALAVGLIVEDGEVLWSSNQGAFSMDHWLTARHGGIRISVRMWNRDDPDVPVIEHATSTPISLEHALGLVKDWGFHQQAILSATERQRQLQNLTRNTVPMLSEPAGM